MGAVHRIGPEEFPQVLRIMGEAFPAAETRDDAGQRALLGRPDYAVYAAGEARVLGFLAVWRLPDFDFIEHFAVDAAVRGRGLGGAMLDELLAQGGRRAVLEAEPPESELARRRVGFYRRHGFSVNPYPYVQPPLRGEKMGVPLLVLSTGGALTEAEFGRCRAQLLRTVYGAPARP